MCWKVGREQSKNRKFAYKNIVSKILQIFCETLKRKYLNTLITTIGNQWQESTEQIRNCITALKLPVMTS